MEKLTEGIKRDGRHTAPGKGPIGAEIVASGTQAQSPSATHPITALTVEF